MDLIKLKIVGYSRSEFQHGAYALILSEESGQRDLSIVIGACEAQSIAIGLESNITVNRPLTHDLFKSFSDSLSIKLDYIYIYKIDNGIFYSFLIFMDKKKKIEIDARTSDAVAISIRFGAPIYTNENVLNQTTSIEKNQDLLKEKKSKKLDRFEIKSNPIIEKKKLAEEKLAEEIEKLNKKLEKALEKENYELAAKIRDLINKKLRK